MKLKKNFKKIIRKSSTFLLALLMIFSTIISTDFVKAYAMETERSLSGFHISLNWNKNDNATQYIWNSSTSEKRVVRLNVGYSCHNVQDGYEAGALQITVPGIGDANRNGVIEATDVAADKKESEKKERDWSYTYDKSKDLYIFTNNKKIEAQSNFSGSFEILWILESRNTKNGYEKRNIQATLSDGHVFLKSNQVSFQYTSQKDTYTLSENIEKLSTPDGLGDNYQDYIWVNWVISNSLVSKARGTSHIYYKVNTPEGAVMKFAKDRYGNKSFSEVNGGYKVNYTPHPLTVTIGYPKDKYNDKDIENHVQLIGIFYDQTQEEVIAQTKQSIHLNEKDYGFSYNGYVVGIDKKELSDYIPFDKAVNGEYSLSYDLQTTLHNDGHIYDVVVMDDVLDITLKDGSFRRLRDDEYTISSVVIPSTKSIVNGNSQPIENDKYEWDLMVRTSGNQDFVKLQSGLFSDMSQKVSVPEHTVAVKLMIKNVDFSVTKQTLLKVNLKFFIDKNDLTIDRTGFIRNLDGIELYKDGILFNTVDKENYVGELGSYAADRDMAMYGHYIQRALADVAIKDEPDVIEVSTNTSLKEFINEKKAFYSSKEITTHLYKQSGNCFINEFSQYTILDQGLKIDEDNFHFDIEAKNLVFKNGNTVSKNYIQNHVNAKIIKDYRNTGRIYIKFDFDFRDNPLKIQSDSFIKTTFNVSLTNDDYLIYGDAYTSRSVSMIGDNQAKIVSNNLSGTDIGNYFGIEQDLWSDINNNGMTNEYITYDYETSLITQALSSYQEVQKQVMSHYTSNEYTTDSTKALLNDDYSYRLKLRTGNSKAKNVIFYDTLEQTQDSEWQGTLKDIDTRYLESKGFAPTVYYSASDNPGQINSGNWSKTKMSDVKSIAIDLGVKIVQNDDLVYVIVHMTSPQSSSLIGKKAINCFEMNFMSIDLLTDLEIGEEHLESNPIDVGLSDPIGNISLIKKDSISGNQLEGAVFTLYNSHDVIVKDDLKTNSVGKITVKNIPFGDYYFKEKKAPQGYILNNEKINVHLNSMNEEVEAKNERLKGSVILYKSSDKNKDLPAEGATYSLYKETNQNDVLIRDDLSTNEFGQTIEVNQLDWGSYYFLETNAAPGYKINQEKIPFVIDSQNVGQTITINTNDKEKPALVTLIKKELLEDGKTFSGQYVSGAVYHLYNSQDEIVKSDLKTNQNGEIQIPDISYGHYYFKEQSVKGYHINEAPIKFSVNPQILSGEGFSSEYDKEGNLHVRVETTNTRKKGTVFLIKKGYQEEPLKDAIFNLYNVNNELIKSSIITNNEGQVSIPDLDWGDYYLKEVVAPQGYDLLKENIYFSVNRDNVDAPILLQVINNQIKGSIILTKIDENNSDIVLKDAVYTLYDSKDNIIIDNLKTDEKGQIKVNNLEWGSYYFLEKQAPTGYSISDEKIRFSVNAMNAAVVQNIVAKDSMIESFKIDITKQIHADEVWFDHGNPTFLFKIVGTDLNGIYHEYYRNIVFDENYIKNNTKNGLVEKTISLHHLPTGDYTVSEISSMRYEVSDIINISANGTKNNHEVLFKLNTTHQKGYVTFINNKFTDENFSHNDNQTNIVKSFTKLTGLSVKTSMTVLKTETIDRNLLEVRAIYDDGSTRLLKNDEYTLDKEKFDISMNGEYTITATYIENGTTVKNSFNIQVLIPVPFLAVVFDKNNNNIGTYSKTTGYQFNDNHTIDQASYVHITGYSGDAEIVIFPSQIENIPVKSLGNGTNITGLENCKSISISNGIEQIGVEAFLDDNWLTGKLIIPDSVKVIKASAFNGCTGLNSLSLGHGLEEIQDEAFFFCNGFLGDLILPDSLKRIGDNAFAMCSNFDGNFKMSNHIEYIGVCAFQDLGSLKGELVLPNTLTYIGNAAFQYMPGLTGELHLPDSLIYLGRSAFQYCEGFTGDLIIPKGLTELQDTVFDDCTGFNGQLVIPDNITKIGYFTFSNCNGLKGTLNIPETVTFIDEGAFSKCSGLTGTVKLPHHLTTISPRLFEKCTGLNSVLFNDNCTEIGNGAFDSCTGLVGSIMNYMKPQLKRIGDKAFYGCTGLTGDLILSDSITIIGANTFEKCTGLNGRLVLSMNLTTIGASAFNGCNGLSGEIVIGNQMDTIDDKAFYYCTGLSQIDLGSHVRIIGADAFYGCTGVEGEIHIPSRVEKIGDRAFAECTKITKLTIEDGVTTIGTYAFKNLASLKVDVIIPTTVDSLGDYALMSTPISNITIFNQNIIIGSGALPNNVVVHGWNGSTAQTYANTNQLGFIALDDSYAYHNISVESNVSHLITPLPTQEREMRKVTLNAAPINHMVTSFKMNGQLINGDSFTMPKSDVVISDVVTQEYFVYESEHNPYPNRANMTFHDKSMEGVKSYTVYIECETESVRYDYVRFYNVKNSYIVFKQFGGKTYTKEKFEIPGDYFKIQFKTDSSGNDFYGFKAKIIPNYN